MQKKRKSLIFPGKKPKKKTRLGQSLISINYSSGVDTFIILSDNMISRVIDKYNDIEVSCDIFTYIN